MNWEKLFSNKRLGQTRRKPAQADDGRSEFQKDFDRVIFSTEFRRLQNKTQVVPLPENDFVHTRLTHSLEASCVGRSLGRLVGDRIIAQNKSLFDDLQVTSADFEAVVAAACLAHDIGNPPFGHSGEDAISEYFRSKRAASFLEGLTEQQIADLQNFEGNAAGFRLLTYTSPASSEVRFGMRLTFATLGAFTKYPKESLPILKASKKASEKKYGFFQSEKEVFAQVGEELGLASKKIPGVAAWHRHPLAFLVEAADDICYSIVDLEDGYKLGRLTFETTEELLTSLIGDEFSKFGDFYAKILDLKEKVSVLRSLAITALANQCAEVFLSQQTELLNGQFDIPLTDAIPATPTMHEISKLSVKKIYQARRIVEVEIAGFEVLSDLLDTFLNAVFNHDSKKSKMVRQLIPDRYFDKDRKPFADKYQNIISITEFVSGLTDNSAIGLYKKFKGISL